MAYCVEGGKPWCIPRDSIGCVPVEISIDQIILYGHQLSAGRKTSWCVTGFYSSCIQSLVRTIRFSFKACTQSQMAPTGCTCLLAWHAPCSSMNCAQSMWKLNIDCCNNDPYSAMSDINISCDGIWKLLESLDPSKAPGPDNIPAKTLKVCAKEVSPILTAIFMQS